MNSHRLVKSVRDVAIESAGGALMFLASVTTYWGGTTEARVVEIVGEDYVVSREGREDWFAVADSIVGRLLSEDGFLAEAG